MYSMLSKIGFNASITDKTIGGGFTWGDASSVAICGVTVVFLMLILLVVFIAVFGKIMDNINGVSKPQSPKPPKNKAEKPAQQINNANIPSDTDESVIAAIAAAVGYMYSGSNVKPVIRAIKPSTNKSQRSAWANAGVVQNTRAF